MCIGIEYRQARAPTSRFLFLTIVISDLSSLSLSLLFLLPSSFNIATSSKSSASSYESCDVPNRSNCFFPFHDFSLSLVAPFTFSPKSTSFFSSRALSHPSECLRCCNICRHAVNLSSDLGYDSITSYGDKSWGRLRNRQISKYSERHSRVGPRFLTIADVRMHSTALDCRVIDAFNKLTDVRL